MEDKGKTFSSQENLEKVFDHLNIGISVHDANGDIIEANEALGKLLDMPTEELIGKKCHEVFHYKDEFIKGCPMLKSVQSKKPENAEFLLHQLNRWVSFITIPVIDDSDKVKSVVHVVRDITERKHLEKSYEDIKLLDMMKEELVTNVSHELRTPLQVVQASLEILVDDITDEGDKDLVERGVENLERLNSLIGDIMKAVQLRESMPSSQEIIDIYKPIQPLIVPVEVVERKPVEMGSLIKECGERFTKDAKNFGITIEYNIDEGPMQVLGDEKELDMAFSHLMNNAIKFNNDGGKITLEAQDMGDRIVLKVTDTGVGIPEDKLPKIFGRFYQVDGSSTRKYEGTGLGLYLVKSLIEKNGGNVWAESEVGVGTKFISVLPSMQ